MPPPTHPLLFAVRLARHRAGNGPRVSLLKTIERMKTQAATKTQTNQSGEGAAFTVMKS